jgi:cytochrome c oxidase assembly protein subunit 15
MMAAAEMPLDADRPRAVGRWLMIVAAMIALTVLVGGMTRLTESGLSIVEWRPVTGILPPLTESAWQETFAAYRATPEYQKVNAGMTLAAFQAIYWMEWGHRLIARLIGVVFLVPFLWFVARRQIPSQLIPRLVAVFVLGGLQGALGWYMVRSGLVDRPDVSHYRLAAHLGVALVLYAYVLSLSFDLLWPVWPAPAGRSSLERPLTVLAAWLIVVMLSGALVAGLDAGMIHNTFPLMDGAVIPEGLSLLSPWVLNLLENPTGVQFLHRGLALITVVAIVFLWWRARRMPLSNAGRAAMRWLVAVALLQVGIGIATLLLVVPLPLAITHQAGALALLTVALIARHASRAPA